MNDFSEIQYGLNCLQSAWAAPVGHKLQEWFDRAMPGFKDQLVALFDAHTAGLRVATFMMSLSEHDDDEDELGRLSMWRAYGGRNGVALVMNPAIFTAETDELKAYSAPVSYESVPEFVQKFERFVDRLTGNESILRQSDSQQVLAAFFYAFRLFVLCTKHPGFREEREWRVFHSPLIEGESDWLSKEQEIVHGVPQEVVKIALRNDTEKGITGLDPKELVNRVIIGPSDQPVPTYHAFFNALESVGIQNPSSKLWMSNIPLRH